MATYIFNFRGTAGYVTDGANSTYVLGETTAQTRNGITFQWTGTVFSVGDRFAGAPTPKLAGVNTVSIGGGSGQFNVTLPTTGDKLVRVAFGDPYFSPLPDQSIVIKDNGTTRRTVGPISPASGNVVDAAGTSMTAASWSGSNVAVPVHFDTTAFQLVLTAGTNYASICTLEITDVAPPTGITATLTATLGALTCVATASVPVAATLSQPLGTLTSLISATVEVRASLAATLGVLTGSASASAPVTASLSSTLGTLTCASSASVAVQAVLAATLDPLILVSTATVTTGEPVSATVDVHLGALTLSSTAIAAFPVEPDLVETTLQIHRLMTMDSER